MKFSRRLLATVCALALLSTMALPTLAAEDADTTADVVVEQAGQEDTESADTPSYYDYLQKYKDAAQPTTGKLTVNAADFVKDEGANVEIGSYQGKDNVVLWD